jgi:hypothetical protein
MSFHWVIVYNYVDTSIIGENSLKKVKLVKVEEFKLVKKG